MLGKLSYFIFVYVQLTLLTPLIFRLWDSRYKMIGWIITPATILIIRYICLLKGIMFGFPFQGELFTFWFIFYYFGIGLSNEKIKLSLSREKLFILYVICVMFQEIEGILWYQNNNFDMATTQLKFSSIITTLTVCAMGYIFVARMESFNRESKAVKSLTFIGDCSFGIYMSHMIVIKVIDKFPLELFKIFPINSLFVLTFSLIGVIVGKKVLGKYSYVLGL